MRPWEGCWQVLLHEDQDEEQIVKLPSFYTTVSLRASALCLYAGGHFLHLRVEKGRRLARGFPPSAADKIAFFRSSSAVGGRCSWQEAPQGWRGEHEIIVAADPRACGRRFVVASAFIDDEPRVELGRTDGTRSTETWRRLSGPGTSPLTGAWQSTGKHDRWFYLVTGGHFAVAHEDLRRPIPPAGAELTDEQMLALADGFGANAGAILVTDRSFDHWPMIATHAGFEARKHPTFRVLHQESDRLTLALAADGSDAATWERLG